MSIVCNYPLGDGRSCANHALDGHIYCVTHRRRPASAQPHAKTLDNCPSCRQPWATLPALHALYACPPPGGTETDAAETERALERAVVKSAIEWRDVVSGKLTVPASAHRLAEKWLADAVSALQRHRETNRD